MNNPENQSLSEDAENERARSKIKKSILADTVVGANLRWKDNLFQLVAISATTIIGAGIGWNYCPRLMGGVLLGGFFGMVF